jgi:hypothetical protein
MRSIQFVLDGRDRCSLMLAATLGCLLAFSPGAMAGDNAPGTGEPTMVRLEVRVIEERTDGTERVATRAATTVAEESATDVFAWWGRLPEGAALPLPEAGSEVAPRPTLGEAAWWRVWQVQLGYHRHDGHEELYLHLGKARYDGPGADGRPAYRRTVESLGLPTGETTSRRWLMVRFTEEEAGMVGASRVLLELQVSPGDQPPTTTPSTDEEGEP